MPKGVYAHEVDLDRQAEMMYGVLLFPQAEKAKGVPPPRIAIQTRKSDTTFKALTDGRTTCR